MADLQDFWCRVADPDAVVDTYFVGIVQKQVFVYDRAVDWCEGSEWGIHILDYIESGILVDFDLYFNQHVKADYTGFAVAVLFYLKSFIC